MKYLSEFRSFLSRSYYTIIVRYVKRFVTLAIFPSSPINCEKLNRANEIFKHIRIFIFFSKDGWSITRGSKRSGRKVRKMDSERTRKYEKESSKKSVRRIVPNNVTRNIYYAISWKSICHRRINESERSRERERIYRN